MSQQANRVFYFAFGSNLLQERIRLRNPSAQYVGVGLLKDYVLSFFVTPDEFRTKDSATWFGGTATVKFSPGGEVFGTVWSLDAADIPSLDKQESVDSGIYKPLDPISVVFVETEEAVSCRTYQGMEAADGPPSPYYLDVVLRGAVKSKLPEHYVEKLRQWPTNGYDGACDLYDRVMQMLPEGERSNFEAPLLREKLSK